MRPPRGARSSQPQNCQKMQAAAQTRVSNTVATAHARGSTAPRQQGKSAAPKRTASKKGSSHRGRPNAMTPGDRQAVRWLALSGLPLPAVCDRMAARFLHQGRNPVCRRTIKRALASGRDPIKSMPVEQPDQVRSYNTPIRVAWAKQYCHLPASYWRRLVFCDSTTLHYPKHSLLGATTALQSRRHRAPAPKAVRQKSVHVYGAVSVVHGKMPLLRVPLKTKAQIRATYGASKRAMQQHQPYNAADYLQVLDALDSWLPHGRARQHAAIIADHATQHNSVAGRALIAEHQLHFMEDFPPQSCDINIIENCWAELQRQLMSMPAATFEEWTNNIDVAWSRVSASFISKAVDSIPRRLAAVIQVDGGCLCHSDYA